MHRKPTGSSFLLFASLAIGLFAAQHVYVARADSSIVSDTTTVWSGANPTSGGKFGPIDMGRANYTAPAPFEITSVFIGGKVGDDSPNNHDGLGNPYAVIYDALGNMIARSVDSCYGEGYCGGATLHFPSGTKVPAQFQFGFIIPDGIQGGATWYLNDITIYGNSVNVREPVVIVPGIMGSVLDRATDGTEVWPNAVKMALSGADSYLDDLTLSPTGGETTRVVAGDILREELGVFSVYQNLIQALTADGYAESSTLFVAPYDWRFGVASSVAAIAPVLARAASSSPDGKINVIAHSMGGLLMKEYLATASMTPVNKLILVATPQLGSPAAYKLLNYGDDLGLNFLGIGLNQNEAKTIAQNMPGVYELLPSRKYVDISGGYVQDFRNGDDSVLNYDQTNNVMTSNAADARNASLLFAADLFHQARDGQTVAGPAVYNILGCLTPTLSGFDLYDDGVVDLKQDTGDGTVPAASAMNEADGFNNYFVLGDETGIDHLGIVKDARPIGLMKDILDITSGTATLPQGISNTLADCVTPRSEVAAETTIEFSVHGAAAIHVYDSAGRHTGSTSSGDVETSIPGSSYDNIGANSFVSVPAGDAYKVITEGSASGTVMLKVKGRKGSTVNKEATYLSVPILSVSTTAELDFSTFDADMNLKIKNDGDATSTLLAPTAVLTDSSTTIDSVPPAIVLPNIPAEVAANGTTTLSFGATDSASGIATITATLNGDPVTNGETVTFIKPGPNVFRITAVDRAGNPRNAELDFNVSVPPPPVSTSTLTLSADTYIDRMSPHQNFGKASVLRVGDGEMDRVLINFDASSTKHMLGSSTIIAAKLIFTIAKNNKGWMWDPRRLGTGALDLFRMTQPWSELGATWDCADDTNVKNRKNNCKDDAWNMNRVRAPFVLTLVASTTVTNAATGTLSFDVTGDIKSMVSNAAPNDGWIILRDKASGGGSVDLASRETKQGARLVVTYSSGYNH